MKRRMMDSFPFLLSRFQEGAGILQKRISSSLAGLALDTIEQTLGQEHIGAGSGQLGVVLQRLFYFLLLISRQFVVYVPEQFLLG